MSLHVNISLQRPSGFELDVDIHIPNRGYTAIYGASGSGKTTLLRCIAGLESAGAKDSIIFNHDVWHNQSQTLPCHQRGIGFVFQDARLMPHLDVSGNLKYALDRRHGNCGPNWNQVSQWLNLAPLLEKTVSQLSAGQQQRVAIGRALLSAPQLLIMDEPLASLDEISKNEILSSLEALHYHLDIPVLYVSHDLAEVTQLADQLIILEQGNVVSEGRTLELCSQLQLGVAHEEQAAAILVGTVKAHDDLYALSEIDIDGETLTLARVDIPLGENIRVRIPARDVSIALNRSEQSSILNIIPCRIDAIEPSTEARILIRLQTGNQFFLSRLTRKSVEKLALSVGDQVFAQIKSVALLSDRQADDHV
jgi:molybdate transport system ATP-binding protein